jgi:hypothetical protein
VKYLRASAPYVDKHGDNHEARNQSHGLLFEIEHGPIPTACEKRRLSMVHLGRGGKRQRGTPCSRSRLEANSPQPAALNEP